MYDSKMGAMVALLLGTFLLLVGMDVHGEMAVDLKVKEGGCMGEGGVVRRVWVFLVVMVMETLLVMAPLPGAQSAGEGVKEAVAGGWGRSWCRKVH